MIEAGVDISIIIVSWNVRDLLRECLAAVAEGLEQGGLAGEVIVVDNGSQDESAGMVRRHFPAVRLIANPANLGFTKGNNQGLRESHGRHALLLNPDTRVAASSLREMVDYLDAHPTVGAVGPRLLYPDGTEQSSRRRFPTLATGLLESTALQRFFPDSAVLRRYYVADRSPYDEQEVDWLVGACLMVRRAAIERVGLLDEGFFMYSEEMDWCRRLKAAGWQIVYLPWARVVHYEAKSSEQSVLARQQHFHDSKVRYFRKYHGTLAAAALRLFIVLSFLCMLAEETIKYLVVPSKRTWRRPRLGVLGGALLYHARRLPKPSSSGGGEPLS